MNNNEHTFRILQLKNKRKLSGVLDKMSVKSIVLPEVYEKDDSTISYVKRVGGQVLQSYSMRNLDIGLEDNFAYYYLISEMYPYTQESENMGVAMYEFDIDVYQTKHTYPLVEDFVTAVGVTNIQVSSKVVIKYSEHLLTDVTSSNGLTSFNLLHQHVIDYTTYSVGRDIGASTGNKYFAFTSKLFPIIYKPHTEVVFTTSDNFEIEITE